MQDAGLGGKLKRRFYESIVYEKSLMNACPSGPERSPNSLTGDLDGSIENAFHGFLNRLAQVCDNKRGGTTVTAIKVLQDFDCVRYFLGSNQRDEQDLTQVKEFVTRLMKVINKSDHKARKTSSLPFRSALWLVLEFNLPRIKVYVKILATWLNKCLESSQIGSEVAADGARLVLRRLDN